LCLSILISYKCSFMHLWPKEIISKEKIIFVCSAKIVCKSFCRSLPWIIYVRSCFYTYTQQNSWLPLLNHLLLWPVHQKQYWDLKL
jgi:hypothetical protein